MNNDTTGQKFIGYEEFRYICFFNEKGSKRTNHFGGGLFRLERAGLFRIPLDPAVILVGCELDDIPTSNCDHPALTFPCTVADLREFLNENGLVGAIDEYNLTEVIAAKAKSPDTFCQGATLKKEAMFAKYKRIWPTIELDFKEAPDNMLLEEAAAIEYAYWVEEHCLTWARSRRKIQGENRPTSASPANPWTGLGSMTKS
jgi:hypothetical protein